ncbi:hypothetical protein Ccrd_009993 [Cynara cardunculus var. scolymus]|uniref:ABI family n=1 Tax=Cynara cardunculus var. scolymus TaxID=59895 RepID=A0A103YM78_CYNCS|nr:hypothetical protein Ccrd_009993 [Cynara cardunculus var. scolymus]
MKTSNSSQDHKQPQTETENDNNFNKSLQDLKDLCSQLHFAADSYQSTFLNSNQKQLVVKNTKEYVRNALVTMVDHLGSVSANLDQHLSKAGSIYQTQVKINFLNQVLGCKLLTCQDYSHKIAVAKVSCREDYLKYNSRYIKPLLAVRDKLSVQSKPQSFQLLNKGKSRRGMLFTKSRRNNEILSVDGSQRI